jgi:tetratricopeptide (TPR) repeat protein
MARGKKRLSSGEGRQTSVVDDLPVRVGQTAVSEPADEAEQELSLLPPAVELWLRKYATVAGISAFLVAATAVIYGQTVFFDFVSYDDDVYVYKNTHVTAGFTPDTLLWAFVGGHSGLWHPLTTLTHVLDWTLYGKLAAGHHLTNVLLHGASCVVLFLALRRLTGATWRSGLVAAFFCLHPAHVESVAWISERKDVLSGLIFGLTLWAYAAYAEEAFSWARYLLVLGLFALGVLSKPMLVTLPFLLLLLDYWPLGRLTSRSLALRALMEKAPLVVLSAATCVITYFVQRSFGGVKAVTEPALRVQMIALGYVRYLAMLVWPFDMAVRYRPEQVVNMTKIVICILALLAVSTVVLVTCRGRWRCVLVGWFWFLGMLVPVSGIVQVGEQSIHDRYTYLSYTGLFVALVWGVAELAGVRAESGEEEEGRVERRREMPSPQTPLSEGEGEIAIKWAWALAAAALAFFALRSLQQTRSWRDSEALYQHELARWPDDLAILSNYGRALEEQGDLDKAEAEYRAALVVEDRDFHRPADAQLHAGLGFVEFTRGNVPQAIQYYRDALDLQPGTGMVHNRLGIAYAALGKTADAEREWSLAIKYDPEMGEAEFNLGKAFLSRKQYAEAVPHLRRAAELDPGSAEDHSTLGAALFHENSCEDGIEECKKAIELQPQDVGTHHALALMYFKLGRLGDAAGEWRQVLKHDPNNAAAAKGLGILLVKVGRGAEAVTPLAYALSKSPQDLELRESLSLACLAAKDPRVAAIGFRKIIEIDSKNRNALNALAWIEATAGDPKLRNGKESVELAEKAAAGPSRFQLNVLDTLAAAYAEAGRFPEAVATAKKAKEAAEKAQAKGLAAEIDARIKTYESQKPYRDPMLAK